LISVFAGCVLFLTAMQSASAQVEKGTLWRDAVATELDVDFGGTGFHSRWQFNRCLCGDLQVLVEQIAPDSIVTGELLMIDGQVLLARNFEQQDVDIEPLVQAPSLMLQLAYAMLNRAQPDGPFAVDSIQQWNATEESRDFKLDTGLATGMFGAPWSVSGSGWKTESGSRRFQLLFEFTVSVPGETAETGSITFSGDLDYRNQEFPYPESTVLDDWRIQWISLNDLESEVVAEGLTLKELRQQVKDP
jgi:hypothetical protein